MSYDRDILIRYLDGSLTETDAAHVDGRLAIDGAFREEFRRLQSIEGAVSEVRADGFEPFFVDRTLKALQPHREVLGLASYDSIRWVFLRTAAVGLVAVVILGALNVVDYQDLELASSWIEAAFGLPSTTVQDAFSYGFI